MLRPTAKSDYGSADPVVIICSSDDEAANEDLSLAIIEKAKRKSSQPSQQISKDNEKENQKEKSKKKTKLKKKKKKTKNERPENEAPESSVPEDEPNSTTIESIPTEANDIPDNIILRRLLRGPRYFDLGDGPIGTCFNCKEEGHLAVNCTAEKREKPCFVCGLFGHTGNKCSQGCHICKKKGHQAKNCPEKNKISQDSKVCLKCGDLGHDMFSCTNDYTPADIQEIECYVCKKKGHLCCADVADSYPKEVSCYNCAQLGHSGVGCAKSKREIGTVNTMAKCYRCQKEGHFARGCPNSFEPDISRRDFSTPKRRPNKEQDEKFGFRSAPNHSYHDFRGSKRKNDKRGDRNSTPKSRNRGWTADDPADFPASSSSPKKKFKSQAKGHTENNHRRSGFGEDYSYSTPHCHGNSNREKFFGRHNHNSNNSQGVCFERHKRFGSPDSGTNRGQRWNNGYSESRFSNSHERFDWS